LGVEYGISRERVRQIENRAFEKLQAEVRAAAESLDDQTKEPMSLLTSPS
jgi:RNA polymerase sigma-32 factor